MDAFSKCHPAVNFLFFLGAMVLSVVIQHPVFLAVGAVTGAVYYLLLSGRQGLKPMGWMLAMFLILTLVNPVFNTMGQTPLFQLFGRPYTLEALLYGAATASMFVIMMLWFGCYNKVLTSDKFTSLFGSFIPAISLLLVMILRLVPNFIRKTKQIIGARKSVGKGAGAGATTRQKLGAGMTVLGALTDWALEDSIVTGDSMRARGYGTAKRSSFMIYRMKGADWGLLLVMAGLLTLTITAMCLGQTEANFVPAMAFAKTNWGVAAYGAYLLIPTILHAKEAIQWHISRSKI